MGSTWFEAKFAKSCGGCGAQYAVGDRILVDIQEVNGAKQYKTLKCPSCSERTEADTVSRREADAIQRGRLPRNIKEMMDKCGTLPEAVNLLGSFEEMDASLRAAGRTFQELVLAAVNACLNQSALCKCDPASWMNALQAAAALGVIPDPGMGPAALAYFIPRGDKVSLDLSYRGLCGIAFNSQQVQGHHEEVVWECEVVLGELVELLRSPHDHERKAGEALRQSLLESPDPSLSEWDRGVIAKALANPTGLAYPWFRYQESPQRLLHHRPRWFTPPPWTQAAPLPWGVYADVCLRGGGRAIALLTRDQCYDRATRGGNVKLAVSKDGRHRLIPATTWGKWDKTPWCRDQAEMMKKTAIRDVMTGGKVPISVRAQQALALEVTEEAQPAMTQHASLIDHLNSVAAPPRQIEQQEFIDDAPVQPEREPVAIPISPAVEEISAYLEGLDSDAYEEAYRQAGIASGVPVEEWSKKDRERFVASLR